VLLHLDCLIGAFGRGHCRHSVRHEYTPSHSRTRGRPVHGVRGLRRRQTPNLASCAPPVDGVETICTPGSP
jgi:hypothetical protein